MKNKYNKYKRVIASRLIILFIAVIFQFFWILEIVSLLSSPHAIGLNIVLNIFAFLFVLYVASQRNESSYKILWLIIILTLPVFGTIMFFFWGDKKTSKPLDNRLKKAEKTIPILLKQDEKIYEEIKKDDAHLAQNFAYIERKTGFPVYKNEGTEYYPIGEKMYEAMLKELEKATKFIYIESFIIAEGKFWNSLLDIMERKVKQGVDIRIIYDDFGSLTTLPKGYSYILAKKGIKCIEFNPIKIFLSGTLNCRDHRKILVIDGKVAFSGGINLADEYINEYEKYGHWKDVGFKTTGKVVQSYTYMFIEFWNAFSKDKILNNAIEENNNYSENKGYVQAFYDSPTNTDAISNDLYTDLLSQATEYAWFCTPYLALGENLRESFIRAAKRGVDVRIYMPGIPDKPIIYRLSRSYYGQLLNAGVKIYEYEPGFLHSKTVLIDDEISTLGSVNLDFRSLFLHFECNTLFFKVPEIAHIKADILEMQNKCRKVEIKNQKLGIIYRIGNGILRIFAPLA